MNARRTRAQASGRLGRNYWALWASSVVSNFGDGLALIAIPWLASAVTRDPLQISLVTLAVRLPWLLFSLAAGVVTDRLDRRRLILWMDVLRFAVMAAFATAVLATQSSLATPGSVPKGSEGPYDTLLLFLLYATAFLLGAAEVLRDNTAQTLLPSIVPAARLERANGRLWGAEIVMNQFAGPPVAGIFLGVAFAVPFFVNAGTFAVAAGFIFMLAGQFTPRGRARAGRSSWRGEIAVGLRWLWRHPLLRPLAFILAVLNATSGMTTAIYVLFAQDVLALDAHGFGLVLTGTAVGGVAAAVTAEWVCSRLGPGASLFLSLAGLGTGLLIIALSSAGVVVWAVLVATGFLVVLWNVITVSLRQLIIPDHLLGRVNSVYRFFGWGAISLGSVLGGALVGLGELVVSREWALRVPFLVAAAMHAAMIVYAVGRISTPRIERARAQAPNAAGNVAS